MDKALKLRDDLAKIIFTTQYDENGTPINWSAEWVGASEFIAVTPEFIDNCLLGLVDFPACEDLRIGSRCRILDFELCVIDIQLPYWIYCKRIRKKG